MPWIQTGLITTGGIVAAGVAVYAIRKMSHKNNGFKAAKEEFALSAYAFSGLYEPLYLMSKGEIKYRTGILGDFATRTTNLSKAPHYREIWDSKLKDCTQWDQEQGLKKMKELVDFVQSAGICRGSSDQIIVDNDTYKMYNTFDDDLIEAGQSARIKHQYWFLDDKILEKGIIEKID